MTAQESKKLELHQQRAADLRLLILMMQLGAGLRGDPPLHAITRTTDGLVQPAKGGAA